MNALSWADSGLYEQRGDLQVCVFPYTPAHLRTWLDSNYHAAVQAIAAVPQRYRTAIAIAVAATYPATDAHSSYLLLLLRWSAACPSCAECGCPPTRRENIGGVSMLRCAACRQKAMAAEQRDIQEAIARGNTWLLGKGKRKKEPEQATMFDLLEAA